MPDLRHVLFEIFDPRKVLFAAALVAAAGLLAGYVAVQKQLDRDLALRQGPPAPVLIQNFAPGHHIGPAEEVRVVGEISMDDAATVFARGASPKRWFVVAPVFPVSAVGTAMLAGNAPYETGMLAAQLERRAEASDPRRTAIGLVIEPILGPGAHGLTAEALTEAILGDGDHGQVVTLSGVSITPEELTHEAHGALAARGIVLAENFVAIKPYTGNRMAVLSRPVGSDLRDDLFAVALLLVACAGLLQLWRAYGVISARTANLRGSETQAAQTVPADHPGFTPLPTQREITQGEFDDPEAATSRPLLTAGFFGLLGLRSRPSRPEDGAL